MANWVSGISLWHRIPHGDIECAALAEMGYCLDGGFLITRMGELWCDSIPMYGYNGTLDFYHGESQQTYHCEVKKGALILVKTTCPLNPLEVKQPGAMDKALDAAIDKVTKNDH